MKRALPAIALLAVLFCAKREAATPATPAPDTPAPARAFRVGLLTPGSINDGGWNAIAWEGLQQIKTRLGAEISHQETKTPAEIEEGFRAFGAKGFDLAFGHGFEFQDAAKKNAAAYPKTIYVTTSGNTVGPNVAPMRFELEQATYILGVIAAHESKTGKAGLVGGLKLPSIDSTFVAFRAGARSVDPKFEVREIYTGNFDDLGAAKLATLSLINAGCDYVFHQANEAGRGVFEACRDRRIRCFGANKDQKDLAPDVIVASAVVDIPAAFMRTAQKVRNGEFKAEIQRFGFNDGIISLAWNERLKATLRPETVAAAQRVEQEIRSGALHVPKGF